jgi:hypothetical protein
MAVLSKEEITELTNFQADICVSICIPAHSSGVAVNEMHDAIVLKNNLQQAKRTLAEQGKSQGTIDKILKEGYDLIDDREFWNSQSQGLALFLAEDFSQVIKTPMTLKESLFVNSSFNILPLLPLITDDSHFFLLMLSKKDAKIYRGDAYGMELLEIEGLPNGMDDVIHFEEKDSQQTMRRAGGGAGSSATVGGGSFHGHGPGLADETEWVTQYLKEVNKTLWTELLSSESAPLILAGTEQILGLYRQVSKYPVVEDSLTGNYDQQEKNAVYQKVKEIAAPFFRENARKALKTYYDNSATELTSSIPEDVIPASFYSKVSDLFLVKDAHLWGSFDEITNELQIHEEKQEGDTCLLNKAAIKTLANGGAVHVLDQEKMPAQSTVAAFMRF